MTEPTHRRCRWLVPLTVGSLTPGCPARSGKNSSTGRSLARGPCPTWSGPYAGARLLSSDAHATRQLPPMRKRYVRLALRCRIRCPPGAVQSKKRSPRLREAPSTQEPTLPFSREVSDVAICHAWGAPRSGVNVASASAPSQELPTSRAPIFPAPARSASARVGPTIADADRMKCASAESSSRTHRFLPFVAKRGPGWRLARFRVCAGPADRAGYAVAARDRRRHASSGHRARQSPTTSSPRTQRASRVWAQACRCAWACRPASGLPSPERKRRGGHLLERGARGHGTRPPCGRGPVAFRCPRRRRPRGRSDEHELRPRGVPPPVIGPMAPGDTAASRSTSTSTPRGCPIGC